MYRDYIYSIPKPMYICTTCNNISLSDTSEKAHVFGFNGSLFTKTIHITDVTTIEIIYLQIAVAMQLRSSTLKIRIVSFGDSRYHAC